MMNFSIKTAEKCAFCKHWYDPTNEAISPKAPKINLWTVDDRCRKKCLKKNYETRATGGCGMFELKLTIQ